MDEARSLQYSIEVKTDVAKAEQDIQNLISQCGRLRTEAAGRVDIEVDADTERATESIRELTGSIGDIQDADVQIDADTDLAEQSVRELTENLGEIGGQDIEIDADTEQAQTDVQDLADRVSNLGRDPPDIEVDVDTTDAGDSIRDLTENLGDLEEHSPDIDVDVDTGDAERNIRDLTDDVGGLGEEAGSLGSAFRKSFLSGIDSGNSLASSIKTGLGGAFTYASEKASDFKDDVVSRMKSVKDGFAHPIETIKNGLGGAIEHAKSKFVGFIRSAEEAADSEDDVGDSASGAKPDVDDLGDAADKASGKFEKLSQVMGSIGKVAIAGVAAATVAVGGFAAASVNTGMTFDSSMSQVAATMGYTVDELNDSTSEASKNFTQLRDFAQEMGANTAFSASQAADALNYMALAGYDAETSMTMLPSVLNLAAAGGIELAQASDMVTDAQSALGLSLDETSLLVDKMARASSKSNTSVAQLGEAILTVGGTAKNLAGGTTELSSVLGVLADNGIKGAEGGTALRNMILSLSAPTDKAAAQLKALGIEVFDAEGNMRPLNETFGDLNGALASLTQEQRTQALNEIFNKVDLKSVNAMLGTSAERWEELGTAIDGAWVNMDSLSGSLSDVGLDLTSMQGKLGSLGISEQKFSEALRASGGNAEAFAGLLLEGADAGTTQAEVLAALGGNLADLQTAFDNTSGAAQAMADTQLDNLAGDITLFKSALEGAQIVISDALTPSLREFTQFGTESVTKLSDAFKEGGLSGAMGALGEILSDALGMLASALSSMIDAGMQLLGALGQGLMDNLPMLVDAGVQILGTLGQGILNGLPTVIGAASQIIVTLASGIGSALPELVPSVVDTLLTVVDTVIENLPLVLDAGMQILGGLAEGIMSAIPMLVERLPEVISSIIGFLSENLPTILDQGSQMLLSLGMGIIEAIPQLVAQLPTIISSIVGFITENLPQIVEVGVNLVVQLGVGLIQAIPQLVAQIPQIISAILGGFAEAPSMLLNVGKSIVEGLWNGISSMASWVTDKVKGFASSIVDGIKGFLGIHSPSTVFAEIGENSGKGVGVGFVNSMKGVSAEMQNAIPTDLSGPKIDVPDPNMPTPPDLTYGVYPNVEDYELPGNGGPQSYAVDSNADAIKPSVDDVSYRVSPVIDDIKTPPVSDLTYEVSPLVNEFSPPGYEGNTDTYSYGTGDETAASASTGGAVGSDDGGGTDTSASDEGGGTPPEVHFDPEVHIEITVQGEVNNESIEELRAQLREELRTQMKELYEEFRDEELQRAVLKNQLAF